MQQPHYVEQPLDRAPRGGNGSGVVKEPVAQRPLERDRITFIRSVGLTRCHDRRLACIPLPGFRVTWATCGYGDSAVIGAAADQA
jgi:hypothetical protein